MPFSLCGSLVPRIEDEPLVASAWERFVQVHAMPRQGVRNLVLDSWLRCQNEAVNPASQRAPCTTSEQIHQLTLQNQDLCNAARPVLEGLRELLRECGSLIMLSDAHGTILQIVGETRIRTAGEGINLALGGQWSEDVIGTNAIGTAVATCKPVQIYASEHFCSDVKRWTCAAAPIRDPLSGALLGVVDVSGVKETFHGHTLGMVMAASHQIESEIARRDAAIQGRLMNSSMEHFTRYGGDGLVLCDHRGRIVRTSDALPNVIRTYGLLPPLALGDQVDGLQLNLQVTQSPPLPPLWLKPEWRHLIQDREGKLGTLLVIPVASSARTSVRERAPKFEAPRTKDSDAFAEIIGQSEVLQATKARAQRMAMLDLPVLLEGETGTGKELFARALHRSGKMSAGPFVALNCGALTRELLASELFGYADGAFTGARRGGLPGKLEQADGGTLFLDEIGEMSLDMQPHLLRVLQDGIVVRLGDTRERRVSVRLLAATNRDLRREVAEGRFREDLYHRLCVLSLPLPALRERLGDIEIIIDHLNRTLALKYGCQPKSWSPSALQAFLRYQWPGNVRELHNMFEAAFALTEVDVIDASCLPQAILRAADERSKAAASVTSMAASSRLDDIEKKAILDAIEDSRHNMTAAARALGISRSTLYVKVAAIRMQRGSQQAT